MRITTKREVVGGKVIIDCISRAEVNEVYEALVTLSRLSRR
jgi:hypothetical protein